MRLSVDSDDPGFVPGVHRAGVKVFFCGYERSHVFTADEEKRMVVVAVLDANGRAQLDAARKNVLRETLYGDVRIEIPAWRWPLSKETQCK